MATVAKSSGIGAFGDAAAAASTTTAVPPSNETKTELMNRFFDSQSDLTSPAVANGLSPPLSRAQSPAEEAEETTPDTVDAVLASLPPIDAAAVMAEWSDQEEEEEELEGLIPVKRLPTLEVTDEVVARLNNDEMAGFNGNYDHEGRFKEWDEVLAMESKPGEMHYILPYCVIE